MKGIVHRDLKPENIFLRSPHGPAVVGDFGLCFFQASEDDRFTATCEAVGPRLFMAPELENGRLDEVTDRCDVYSLGKVLYWLLSGGRAFSRERHRDRERDLKGYNLDSLLGWENIYLEHVNRILDLMIVQDPRARRGVRNIISLMKNARRLIDGRYNPVADDIPQLCYYCGDGQYVPLPQDEELDSGYRPSEKWKVTVCDACGHVQAFRLDKARHTEWWKQR